MPWRLPIYKPNSGVFMAKIKIPMLSSIYVGDNLARAINVMVKQINNALKAIEKELQKLEDKKQNA